ncbi:MAG: D-erythronate dehydrogenase [Rhodoblastus sp.]
MKVLVTGAAGMIGRKFCQRLAADGAIAGRKISALHMMDVIAAGDLPGAAFAVYSEAGDISDRNLAPRLIADRPDLVVHLAAIVSGEAEMDFDKGYAVNLDGTRHLFDAIRTENIVSGGQYRPRVLFSSSIAVFGAPFPESIPDEFHLTPLTSYGAQKAAGELLLADFTRKGFFDGVGLRFPTICVRPGRPNAAASGFFSNIIREPLAGQKAILPVPETVRHTHATPRAAVGFLLHAATLDGEKIGPRRNLSMPGVCVTVGEQIEALRKVAGATAVALIERRPDEAIARIVSGWPERFEARRARELGFAAESSFEEIVRAHIADELDRKTAQG